ncbi:hypothetical protein IJ00_22665 [Calothrix sp. 336/3]|uniref:hypothetical protein n=1 Tax=Calothrix sp. 336/3 TaxID=1337936 RepID=UPI0004E45D7B|nr:hypothetical protein [Calothrix sp. 336/3]AKG23717.1 hypothetical protein IJ00_22665 [Calothrix sp. 336/3]
MIDFGAAMVMTGSGEKMIIRYDSVSSLFQLNRMGQRPWMLDQFDEFGLRGNPLGGKYEGRIEAKLENGRWVPKTFLYRAANANWWDMNIELWA